MKAKVEFGEDSARKIEFSEKKPEREFYFENLNSSNRVAAMVPAKRRIGDIDTGGYYPGKSEERKGIIRRIILPALAGLVTFWGVAAVLLSFGI